MELFSINYDLCNKCGYCISDCGTMAMIKNEEEYPVQNPQSYCIKCGHCEAICPEGAIEINSPEIESSFLKTDKAEISELQMANLIQMRRSIRTFQNKPVEKTKIEKLLEIVRYAPSAGNGQPVKWMIIHGENEIRKLTDILVDHCIYVTKNNPETAQQLRLQMIINAWQNGQNIIFRGAPHLAIAYTSKNSMMPLVDSSIALSYFEIACQSFGMGGTWAGYFYLISQIFPELPEKLGLEENHEITGGFMFGYPLFEYYRIPQRNKQTIHWK